MSLPSDHVLTEQGFGESQNGSVLLIGCGALAREILALKAANSWNHMVLRCLPAKLHLYPEKITPAVREAIHKGREDGFATIYILYADCGTGGHLDSLCAEEGVERIAGPHCYSFFDGNEAFAERADDEMRSFYLTDFLVKQFDAFVWRPMGLDRHPELRDMYFGNYEKLIYLAQTNNPELDAKAALCAERLGLVYERRSTGYGDLEISMKSLAVDPLSP
ncbi:DUF1638 domain-containing protein [Pararhizobium sp. IMCC21322]|uniref:DUF1638 domain-containing protein n=1 Tax=Pararhizobium sp. IMCC21322 TaxID=3067903 RepID=UPI002740A2BD|nr:DUF1638 domain-containing protein [Pararhizobium sp. IMCC21322]